VNHPSFEDPHRRSKHSATAPPVRKERERVGHPQSNLSAVRWSCGNGKPLEAPPSRKEREKDGAPAVLGQGKRGPAPPN